MPLQETSGTASYDAFGGGAAAVPTYIEDVFSTWLYTGNGSTQTITNGIDVTGKGALVWIKNRSDVKNNILVDTARGANNWIASNLTNAQASDATKVSSFSSTGFTVGSDSTVNLSTQLYASWTFRKQPKFFDVVTWTGDGASSRAISHNLGSTPGCVIVKRTNNIADWVVYHRSVTGTTFLNLTDAVTTANNLGTVTAVDSTTFTVTAGTTDGRRVNSSANTYVAYLFAHNAGGFGLTGTDNVISCGSFTTDASGNATVNLGYEPQWYLVKRTDGNGAWGMADIMRGMTVQTSGNSTLFANTSGAESTTSSFPPQPNATGFSTTGLSASAPHIYIAIRRGPMKTPTSGTSVYQPIYDTSNLANKVNGTVGPIDLTIQGQPTGAYPSYWMTTFDRLRGSNTLLTASTAPEAAGSVTFDTNVGVRNGTWFTDGGIVYNFRRAPGFFDVVCYTATGAIPSNISHNLGAVPELLIVKKRNALDTWTVYSAATGNNKEMSLNNSGAPSTNVNVWNSTTPTASVFTVGLSGSVNGAGETYVAYLFASCPGVSKVGSYTGTGATQTISCGFAARFVLIKRISATGDWWVWDTARGMVAGTDPRLALNSTAAQTNANWVYTDASGFQIVTTDATVNASGGSYIFLAIA